MALRLIDIFVGTVAFFDDQLLLAETSIDGGEATLDRPGPFVCIQTKDTRSVWCAITSEARHERLFLEKTWRLYGSDKWREDDQFLNDGLNTFFGPNAAFVRAGATESAFRIYRRPKISPLGIEAILAEVDKQGGPLL